MNKVRKKFTCVWKGKSMDVFLRACTLGRGAVPVLPDDVRRHVWKFTYPRPVLWCSSCGVEVMVVVEDGSRVLVNTHPNLWLDTPRCVQCRTTHPLPPPPTA